MKEQLIGFETAKLASEKGFDIPSARFYCTDGVIRFDPFSIFYLDEDEVDELEKDSILINDGRCIVSLWEDRNLTIGNILAPTQSLLQKWLREKHKLHTSLYLQESTYLHRWRVKVFYLDKLEDPNIHFWDFDTYEEALEKGLQGALNLI